MLTLNSSKWLVVFVAVMMMALLPGMSLADGGDEALVGFGPITVVADATANDYISVLDNLRVMSQFEAQKGVAERARDAAVFDHSGELARLQDQAILIRNRPAVATANDYVTHLEQLRSAGSVVSSDTGGFITALEQLRQSGQGAGQPNEARASTQ